MTPHIDPAEAGEPSSGNILADLGFGVQEPIGSSSARPKFSRVALPPDRALNDRASMTLLKHFNLCPRSGYFYAKFKGETASPEMQRGKAGHRAVEQSIRAAIEQGEPAIPAEIAKVIVNEALAETHVPIEEHDRIREGVYRWSAETAIDPSAVIALETLFVLDIDGFQVRCRIDLAELTEGGAAVHVDDWKFSVGGVPGFEEIARVRPDGTRMGKAFQLILYALALAYGRPVREEWCAACDGVGIIGSLYAEEPGDITTCEACGGKGRHETVEPFGVADRAQRFDLEFVYPLIEDREGKMVRRPVTLTRLELEEYRESLRAIVAHLREAERTGNWPALQSDQACGICPARQLCPIPAELRDHRGEVNTPDEAAEAMSKLDREKAEHRARQTELRNFAKANGGRIVYDGKVAELVYSEVEEIRDREEFLAAVDRAVRYGETLDRSKFIRAKGRTDFKTRDLTEQELAEMEGSDGSE